MKVDDVMGCVCAAAISALVCFPVGWVVGFTHGHHEAQKEAAAKGWGEFRLDKETGRVEFRYGGGTHAK